MSLDRYLQRGKVNGAGKGLFTLSVTLAFTLASEQVPKQERVSRDRMGKMAAERHRDFLYKVSLTSRVLVIDELSESGVQCEILNLAIELNCSTKISRKRQFAPALTV